VATVPKSDPLNQQFLRAVDNENKKFFRVFKQREEEIILSPLPLYTRPRQTDTPTHNHRIN